MEILGIIPARGGSKEIPDKNIYQLNGKPLISYTIAAAKNSRQLTRLILTSDSQKIINVSTKYGLKAPFIRPRQLAQDDTPALPVIQHAAKWLKDYEDYQPDYIVLLQPTSPLRTAKHIDEAITLLINSDADSIVSVVKVPHHYNPVSIMRLEKGYLKPYLAYEENKNIRQLKPEFYARNGAAIYAFTNECLIEKNSIYGDKILAYEMKKSDSIDIDDELDLLLCEALLKQSESKGNPPSDGK